MATNNFATNKTRLVLIHALLEWTLIFILLLHSLFTFLITRFSQHFGLHPPCFCCARLDRFFHRNLHTDSLCEFHSKEVSDRGYCSNHQKLVEFDDFYEDFRSFDLGSRKRFEKFVVDLVGSEEEDEVRLKCSCCGVNLERKSLCFVGGKRDSYEEFEEIRRKSEFRRHREEETEEAQIEVIKEENPSMIKKDSSSLEKDLVRFSETLMQRVIDHSVLQKTGEVKKSRVEDDINVDEIEEDEIPETPSSTDSLNHLPKKLLLLERGDSWAEESFDGSPSSSGGDPVDTPEKLKSALKAQRRALFALYNELEKERNASAVAAGEAMAMINRLQDEKAAVQMEAVQYARMMEEQCEYDQEAMEVLKELVIQREKELESCRRKVADNEARGRKLASRSDDGDGTSVEWPSLESVWAELEEKIYALSDEEDRYFSSVVPVDDFYEKPSSDFDDGSGDRNKLNGGNDDCTTGADGFCSDELEKAAVTRFELSKKSIHVEEEVDEVYRRLVV